jgi:hypothetical protein
MLKFLWSRVLDSVVLAEFDIALKRTILFQKEDGNGCLEHEKASIKIT